MQWTKPTNHTIIVGNLFDLRFPPNFTSQLSVDRVEYTLPEGGNGGNGSTDSPLAPAGIATSTTSNAPFPTSNQVGATKSGRTAEIAVPVIIGSILLALGLIFLILRRRRQQKAAFMVPDASVSPAVDPLLSPNRASARDQDSPRESSEPTMNSSNVVSLTTTQTNSGLASFPIATHNHSPSDSMGPFSNRNQLAFGNQSQGELKQPAARRVYHEDGGSIGFPDGGSQEPIEEFPPSYVNHRGTAIYGPPPCAH